MNSGPFSPESALTSEPSHHFIEMTTLFFKARAKDLGDSLDEAEDHLETRVDVEESPSKIILGTSNRNFVAEEKSFMGLHFGSRKASMPVFQVSKLTRGSIH